MLLLIALIGIAYSTELTILKPSLLTSHGNNSLPVNVADFGYVPYGKTISGDLFYMNDTCQPINITLNQSVVLAECNSCTFLAQTMNAQKAGAKMLIMIYNGEEDITRFLLLADHSSQQVQIPSMMVNKYDGMFLKKKLQDLNDTITVSIEFHLPQNKIVELEYHMSSLDSQSYQFLTQFQPFAQQMIDELKFTPVFVEDYCRVCEQMNFNVTRQDCISGGRYCAIDPDLEGPLTGRDVMFQDLTQLCVLQEYNVTQWWNYAIVYSTMCLSGASECSSKVMNMISINESRIADCINASFVGNNSLMDDNTILAAQREKIVNTHLSYWPALFINGDMFRGDLFMVNFQEKDVYTVDQFAVLEAICDGYIDSSRPALCNSTGFFTISDGEIKQEKNQLLVIGVWVGIGLFILFLLFASFLLYRRHLMKEVRGDVNTQVESVLKEYYKMTDVK